VAYAAGCFSLLRPRRPVSGTLQAFGCDEARLSGIRGSAAPWDTARGRRRGLSHARRARSTTDTRADAQPTIHIDGAAPSPAPQTEPIPGATLPRSLFYESRVPQSPRLAPSPTISAYTARTLSAYTDQPRYSPVPTRLVELARCVRLSLQRGCSSNTSWPDREGEGLRQLPLVSGSVVANRDRSRRRCASTVCATGSVIARHAAAMACGLKRDRGCWLNRRLRGRPPRLKSSHTGSRDDVSA